MYIHDQWIKLCILYAVQLCIDIYVEYIQSLIILILWIGLPLSEIQYRVNVIGKTCQNSFEMVVTSVSNLLVIS